MGWLLEEAIDVYGISLQKNTLTCPHVCVPTDIHVHSWTCTHTQWHEIVSFAQNSPLSSRLSQSKARFSQWFTRSSVVWPWPCIWPGTAQLQPHGPLYFLQICQSCFHFRAFVVSKNSSVRNALLPDMTQHPSSLSLGFYLNITFIVRSSLTPLFRIVIPISIITHPNHLLCLIFPPGTYYYFTSFTHLFYWLYFIKR